jgi:hypothetical protein
MITRASFGVINRLRTIFYALFFIYLVYLTYDLLYIESGRYLWTLFAIALIMIPFAFERLTGMYFPWEIKIVIVLSLLLHTAGEFHRWYYTLTHFDKISHMFSAAGIAYLVFLFIILVELYYGLEWKATRIIFFIILMTASFAFFWEWWEIFSDNYFGSKFFWDMQDGIGDAAANIAGAIIVSLDVNKYLKKRSPKEVAEDFIVPDGSGHYAIKWAVLPAEKNKEREDVEANAHKGTQKDGYVA